MKLFTLMLLLVPLASTADGLPLREGRYPHEVLEFQLTENQKQVIDHYRACQLERSNEMNIFTPYVFELTKEQAIAVRNRVGFSPTYFNVFETVRGFNDAGPFWNLVLRYSMDRIEVPVDLLLSDRAARKAHAVQGWKLKNPCLPRLRPQ